MMQEQTSILVPDSSQSDILYLRSSTYGHLLEDKWVVIDQVSMIYLYISASKDVARGAQNTSPSPPIKCWLVLLTIINEQFSDF